MSHEQDAMKEKEFISLVEILKLLEKEDINKSSIESAIVKLIDAQDKDMTAEQRAAILKKFIYYVRNKRDTGKSKTAKEHIHLGDSGFY